MEIPAGGRAFRTAHPFRLRRLARERMRARPQKPPSARASFVLSRRGTGSPRLRTTRPELLQDHRAFLAQPPQQQVPPLHRFERRPAIAYISRTFSGRAATRLRNSVWAMIPPERDAAWPSLRCIRLLLVSPGLGDVGQHDDQAAPALRGE